MHLTLCGRNCHVPILPFSPGIVHRRHSYEGDLRRLQDKFYQGTSVRRLLFGGKVIYVFLSANTCNGQWGACCGRGLFRGPYVLCQYVSVVATIVLSKGKRRCDAHGAHCRCVFPSGATRDSTRFLRVAMRATKSVVKLCPGAIDPNQANVERVVSIPFPSAWISTIYHTRGLYVRSFGVERSLERERARREFTCAIMFRSRCEAVVLGFSFDHLRDLGRVVIVATIFNLFRVRSRHVV